MSWGETTVDIFSKAERSRIMGLIKGKDTAPEILIRKYLFSRGFRFRVNDTRYPGKPDIILPKYKTAIFVHGCFWHGHPDCKWANLPKTNTDFWAEKISKNISRDNKNKEELQALGWKVLLVWDCELRNKKTRDSRIDLLVSEILQ